MTADAINMDGDDLSPLDLDSGEVTSGNKIQAFGPAGGKAERAGTRTSKLTGTGAVRVKTFYAKLRADAIEFLDDQVNQWLEQHPQYEVKFVTTNIGPMVGKSTEPSLFINVWV